MARERLIPPNPVAMPAAVTGPMPRGDAQDPAVDQIALQAARDIDARLKTPAGRLAVSRITIMQLRIAQAINVALDRCQALGGRRVK